MVKSSNCKLLEGCLRLTVFVIFLLKNTLDDKYFWAKNKNPNPSLKQKISFLHHFSFTPICFFHWKKIFHPIILKILSLISPLAHKNWFKLVSLHSNNPRFNITVLNEHTYTFKLRSFLGFLIGRSKHFSQSASFKQLIGPSLLHLYWKKMTQLTLTSI